MLNHLRLTHPSAGVIASQPLGEQAVDRTLTSHEETCKPDRCSGAIAAATSPALTGDCFSHAQHMVSIGPHGSIRCTSPLQPSPRQQWPQQQQQQQQQQQRQQQQKQQPPKKRHAGQSACPYHDHETMTISLVGQANVYRSPARAVSPHRPHKNPSHSHGRESGDHSCANDAYVRLVSVRPTVGRQQQDKVQPDDKSEPPKQQRQAAPVSCPEPAAAAASSSSRKAALAQLRMARRQQRQLLPADVEQRVSEKMSGRKKPAGCGANWSSRKLQDRQQRSLSDSGEI